MVHRAQRHPPRTDVMSTLRRRPIRQAASHRSHCLSKHGRCQHAGRKLEVDA
jgi:hypothetical protein